jgi:hypothetical protein
VKQDVGEVADCCPKVKKDMADMKWELEKLKEERRADSAAGSRCNCSACPKVCAGFNSLKTSDLLHRLTAAPT